MIETAVAGAYRVFEDYLSWGQKAAAQQTAFAQQSQRADARARETWRVPVGPKPLDMQSAATQWLEMWQEMYRLWLGTVTQLMPASGMPPMPGFPGFPGFPGMFPFANGAAGPTPFAAQPSAAPAQTVSSDIALETTQPVKLSLRVTQPPAQGSAQAILHRAEGEGKLVLSLDANGARMVVPENQPAGRYSGVLQDAQGTACGTVLAQVSAPAGNAR